MRERKQWSFVCLLLFNSVSTVYHIWCRLTAAEHQAIKCTIVAHFFPMVWYFFHFLRCSSPSECAGWLTASLLHRQGSITEGLVTEKAPESTSKQTHYGKLNHIHKVSPKVIIVHTNKQGIKSCLFSSLSPKATLIHVGLQVSREYKETVTNTPHDNTLQ